MLLPPEVVDKLRREREEQERPGAQVPLYPPEIQRDLPVEEEELTESRRVIVIDLL
jgi:hypothetical protein